MKKTLILATLCGLLASLAPPAFASDSPATYIEAKATTTSNQQTVKESTPAQKTFVIAERADKVKDSATGILASAKSIDKDVYVLTAYDSALAKPGIVSPKATAANGPGVITAASLDSKSIYALAKFSADPCWPPAPMTSASASGTSTFGGVEITLKI